jgi:hypothetical protein
VPYVAGYPTRLYGRLRNSGSGSQQTYLAVPVLSPDLKASLALIYSSLYKSKIKPFSLSISIYNGISTAVALINCC